MFQDFINKTLGKAIDVDGLYGPQCVDLFNYWNKLHNNCYINCRPSGYARSIAQNKANNGILEHFVETPVNNMITGTVVVWGNCKVAPMSHVGFFVKDNGNGTFQCLQQNAPKPYVTLSNMPYEGIVGAFIPKQLVGQSAVDNTPKADQILHVGSKVKFDGVFKVDIIDIPNNLFGSTRMTGKITQKYHFLPSGPFIECDSKGNPTPDQLLGIKNSYVKNDTIYNVEAIHIPTNSAKLIIEGRPVWILSKCLYEVSNN